MAMIKATAPNKRDVRVDVLPARLDVIDDWDDVASGEQVDQTVEKHLLDLHLREDLERFIALFEQPDVELEKNLSIAMHQLNMRWSYYL